VSETEYFEKTPKKANRWFTAFIIFSLLFGLLFSLNWFINWLLFFAASYSLFMSYFLLPVQPKIFQNRPPRSGGSQFKSTFKQTNNTTPEAQRKRAVFIIVGLFVFVTFFIPIMINVIQSFGDDTSNTDYSIEESTTEDYDVNVVQKGNDFFNAQQYDSAEKYYDMAIEENAEDYAAVYGKGIVAYNRGNIDIANQHFMRAYEGGYRYAWLSWALADMNDKRSQTQRAIELYKESVQLDSAFTDSYLRLAELEPANGQTWRDLAEKHK
jgi:tetratricopeptide (TPR) repeat protein